MRIYTLQSLNNQQYNVFLVCLTNENTFSFTEELQKEILIQEKTGSLLIDQVLVTGNNKNRFVLIPYERGKIDFSMARNTTVSPKIRQLSSKRIKENITHLEFTILTKEQQDKVLDELPF